MSEVVNKPQLDLTHRAVGYWFKRYSGRARKVMAIANRDAKRGGQSAITPANVLFGILVQPEAVACHVLTGMGVELEAALARIGRTSLIPDEDDIVRLPGDRATQTLIDESIRVCISNGHDGVGTEHLLVALARVNNPELQSFFSDFALDDIKLNQKAIELLDGSRDKRDPLWGNIIWILCVSVLVSLVSSAASVWLSHVLAYRGLESWRPSFRDLIPEVATVFCITVAIAISCLFPIQSTRRQLGVCLAIGLSVGVFAGWFFYIRILIDFGSV